MDGNVQPTFGIQVAIKVHVFQDCMDDPSLGQHGSAHNRIITTRKTVSLLSFGLINSIGFVWDPLNAQWMKVYK